MELEKVIDTTEVLPKTNKTRSRLIVAGLVLVGAVVGIGVAGLLSNSEDVTDAATPEDD